MDAGDNIWLVDNGSSMAVKLSPAGTWRAQKITLRDAAVQVGEAEVAAAAAAAGRLRRSAQREGRLRARSILRGAPAVE